MRRLALTLRRPALAATLASLAAGCGTTAARTEAPTPASTPAAALVTVGDSTPYDPSRDLGPLFHDVQMAGVFPDSKTFVDATPRSGAPAVRAAYGAARGAGPVDLAAFVRTHFDLPVAPVLPPPADVTTSMERHIEALWPALTRPADRPDRWSSRLPLPQPYVVPGGRFREIYYWDSYFTMLGLAANGRFAAMRGMLEDFAHLVRTHGHIPNGTRSYYLSRSQPPYFAAMVGLYAQSTDTAQALAFLPAIEAEHAFWMDGERGLAPGTASRRVVRLAGGALLNRYWDDREDPRPESYREDVRTAEPLPAAQRPALWREIRAAAESGWDFSSRWMRDPRELRTLETTSLVPVDLNALLYHAERTIAALRRVRGAPGDAEVARAFTARAEARLAAMRALLWDEAEGFYFDARWRTGDRVTDRPTLAAAAALYFGVATPAQGARVADRLARDFLRAGGFVTTTIASGQQWDAPNGWAPLQWLSAEGARRYGRPAVADTARARWIEAARRVHAASGKMTEKYDVLDARRAGGGGEYPGQDGFGWTNGVTMAFLRQLTVP